jgi:hypothetical protein
LQSPASPQVLVEIYFNLLLRERPICMIFLGFIQLLLQNVLIKGLKDLRI